MNTQEFNCAEKKRLNLLALFIGLLGFVVFSNTLNHDYAWDDRIVITENPYVKSGVEGLSKIWVKQRSDKLHDQIGYRPVPLTMFAVEQELSPDNPKVGHWVNVLLYALLCVVVVMFLFEVVRLRKLWLIALIAALFTVHPLHTEVVANIKSRDELLQLLFSLLSVIFFSQWLRNRASLSILLAACMLLLGVFSKENAVTTIGLFALLVLFRFRDKEYKPDLKLLVPVFGVLTTIGFGALVFGLTSGTEYQETSGTEVVYESPILGDCFRQLDDPVRLFMNRNLLIARYIGKFLLPTDLVYHSGFNHIEMYPSISTPTILGVVLTLALLLVLALSYRRKPKLFFAIALFLITIFPFLHLYRPMPDTIADRFAFSASLGLSMMLVFVGHYVLESVIESPVKTRRILITSGSFLVLFYSYQAWSRNKVWKDNLTLFSADIDKLEDCAKAHEYLADALHVKYETTQNPNLVPQIIHHYERSIQITDLSYYAFLKLGSNYADWGNAQRGIQVLERAVDLYPERADPHFYLGDAYFRSGQFKRALPHLTKSMAYSPALSDAYYLRSRSLLELDSLNAAMMETTKSLDKFPDDLLLRDVLVDAYLRQGDMENAFRHLDTILQLQPRNSAFWKKAIGLHQKMGLNAEADSIYKTGLRLGVKFN